LAGVRIKNLTKRYGNVIAVNDLSIEIKDEELMVLLGPSGCGKTTVLRCIAGLETPDKGDIHIGDRSVVAIPPKDRDVAMVFQSYALYPHMKVFDNIALPLKLRKHPKEEIAKRVKETAELLKIGHLLDRRPGHLSGGEKQRVALGRAIIREPKVFLMDEPLSNLDAKLRVYMRAELKRLQKELGITTIFVTHDQAEGMSMADRIAVMNDGELQQIGSPDDIYVQPINTFVGGFIGSPPMNFVDCSFVERKNAQLDAGIFTFAVSDDVRRIVKAKATSSELMLGVRPEDIMLDRKGKSPESIEANVYVVEPLGSEIITSLKVGENLIKAKTPPDSEFQIGEKVWVTFNKDKMHLFDRKTGRSIV